MQFGIMFFSSAGGGTKEGKYRLMREAVSFADRNGFVSASTPERHFHEFGGLFPNPAVTSAALAMITERLQLRAGSLILPLHDTVRIAEEWSVIDNLSGGRAAVSIGSGWNVDDFVFFPDRYERRQQLMYEQIETLRKLWRGEEVVRENSFGKPVKIRLFPRPVQEELPLWITSSGHAETFVSAGRHGANVLTHLIGQDLPTLAGKIELYRAALDETYGDEAEGKVTLMLHTFLGPDVESARAAVYGPFREYLRSAISLEEMAAEGGGAISGGHKIDPHRVSPPDMEQLLDLTAERYLREGSLIGTPESCARFVWKLQELGVDEVACLIDFLDDADLVLEALPRLAELVRSFSSESQVEASAPLVEAFMEELE